MLSRETMLDRFLASDARFDGRFLTGVLTTGIYCLPSCTARKPRPENVRFFKAPTAAEAAGLRPCKRCKPELFYRGEDPDLELAETLVARVRERPADYPDVAALAVDAGVGTSKLTELLRFAYHTTPAALLRRARVDAARRRLLESDATATDVAFDAGFASLSVFNQQFRRGLCTTPRRYRELAGADRFELLLPAGFRLQRILGHLGRDAESPSEQVRIDDGMATAAVATHLDGTPALLQLRFGVQGAERRVDVRVETAQPAPTSARVAAHRVVLRLLGLGNDPRPFERHVTADAELAPLVDGRRGLTVPQTRDLWDALIWVIAGQQIHLGLAYTLRRRLIERAGTPVAGMIAPPTPDAVAALGTGELGRLGFSRAKADYLDGVAHLAASGELELGSLARASAPAVEKRLLAVRGLGPWSVHYLMMRALGFADCLPAADAGLARGVQRFFALDTRPDAAEVRRRLSPFAPYRSLATFHFWSLPEDKP